MRSTLGGGWRGGVAAAAGAACGNTVQALAAALLVPMIFARWPLAALVVRGAGAVFLVWLGAGSLRRAFAVNLLNPAITTFYIAVVPSFVPHGAGRGYYALLCAAHVGIALACHVSWAAAVDALKRHTGHPRVRQALEVSTGLVLMALAVQVLLSR